MTAWRRSGIWFAGALLCTAPSSAQVAALSVNSEARPEVRPDVRVEVRVLSVVGDLVRIDRGAAAGIEPGDRVILIPLGRARVESVTLHVNERDSTVRVEPGVLGLAPGVAGIVILPAVRFDDEEAAQARADGRPAIQWQSPENGWDGATPLLADARASSRSERPSKWRGRGYLTGDFIRDRNRVERDDTFSRVGLDLRGENVFGFGGTMRVDGEFNYRSLEIDGEQIEDETLGRLDRLSYSVGGTREQARRVEFGRFLPREFPELGLLDGAEVSWRTPGGHRFGTSFGYLPSYDRERTTGDTLQISTWGSLAVDTDQRFEVGGALQKTWHEGDADRDLLLTRIRWSPDGPWSAYATAWWDFYGSDDVAKEDDVELTQMFANVTRMIGTGSGISLSGNITRYPELLRGGLQDLPLELLTDGESQRISLGGWTRVTSIDRVRVRLDHWSDQESDGGGGELGWERDVYGDVFDRFDVSGFVQQARFTDVYGLRFGTGGPLGPGRWRVHVDTGLYEQLGFSGGQGELLQNAFRLGWDGSLGRDWFLSLTTTYRFGDEQDAVSLGFLLQRSF